VEWNTLALQRFNAGPFICSCGTTCTCGAVHAIDVTCTPDLQSLQQSNYDAYVSGRQWANDTTDFHVLPRVAVGARVILLMNLNPTKRLVNGSAGTVTSLSLDSQRHVTTITIMSDDTTSPTIIRRSNSTQRLLDCRLFSKQTFPLMLGYAMTAHKCQGATLSGRVIIDCQSAFACGLLYTMLTRVTCRENLRIIGALTPVMLTPVPLVADGDTLRGFGS
jgi:hypothetical protein